MQTATQENDHKLKELLIEVFMMEEEDYCDDKGSHDIEGWDSLATVAMAVGVQEVFGHHMTPQEAGAMHTIGDIRSYLRSKKIDI